MYMVWIIWTAGFMLLSSQLLLNRLGHMLAFKRSMKRKSTRKHPCLLAMSSSFLSFLGALLCFLVSYLHQLSISGKEWNLCVKHKIQTKPTHDHCSIAPLMVKTSTGFVEAVPQQHPQPTVKPTYTWLTYPLLVLAPIYLSQTSLTVRHSFPLLCPSLTSKIYLCIFYNPLIANCCDMVFASEIFFILVLHRLSSVWTQFLTHDGSVWILICDGNFNILKVIYLLVKGAICNNYVKILV